MTRAACCLLLAALPIAAGCSSKANGPVTAGGHPVSHWLDELKNQDAKARKKAVKELGHIGRADPAAIPAVAESLKDLNPGVRMEAALALFNLGEDARDAIPALSQAAGDKDPKVRQYVARALAQLGVGP
jgi:HEAT repeat protein